MLQRLAAAVVPDSAAWNREVHHADAVTPEALIAAGLALPLFGGRRLMVVRGVADVPAKTVERLRAALEAAGALPGSWPAEGTTVVFVAAGADRRSPALRLLPEAERVEARPPAGRAIAAWLRDRARGLGLELLPEAADALVALVGDDLGRLAGELEKAAIFAGDDRRLTESVVRALAGESRLRHYWELAQALENGDRGAALRLLDRLLAAGEEPLALLATIVGHLRDLWRVQAGLAERADARAAARLLPRRRPDFAVERLMARATTVGREGLARAVGRCFEVERRLKTSAGDPRALLTMLVDDLARA